MFKCMLTRTGRISRRGHITKPGQKMVKVILERREKTYTNITPDAIVTTKGWEIVREIAACAEHVECAGRAEGGR